MNITVQPKSKNIVDSDDLKIKDNELEFPCISPSHNVPAFQVFPAGINKYMCPACGKVTKFFVQQFF